MPSSSEVYSGARALTELHDRHLRAFLGVWRASAERGLELPPGSDPNTASLDALLVHVLGCSARYLNWICLQLELPRRIDEDRPAVEGFRDRAEEYMEGVLAAWAEPLEGLTEERAYRPTYASSWGTDYCLDAMLEHAVMHPLRHIHQLKGLLTAATEREVG